MKGQEGLQCHMVVVARELGDDRAHLLTPCAESGGSLGAKAFVAIASSNLGGHVLDEARMRRCWVRWENKML